MDNDNKTAVRPKLARTARASNAKANNGGTVRRAAARKAYRAKIESLLDKSRDEQLADVWRRVYPLPIDAAYNLPDRQGIIEDLADFAAVLQPNLDRMKADRLCQLIEKYAACESCQSGLPASHSGYPHRTSERGRRRGPLRVAAGYRHHQAVFA